MARRGARIADRAYARCARCVGPIPFDEGTRPHDLRNSRCPCIRRDRRRRTVWLVPPAHRAARRHGRHRDGGAMDRGRNHPPAVERRAPGPLPASSALPVQGGERRLPAAQGRVSTPRHLRAGPARRRAAGQDRAAGDGAVAGISQNRQPARRLRRLRPRHDHRRDHRRQGAAAGAESARPEARDHQAALPPGGTGEVPVRLSADPAALP